MQKFKVGDRVQDLYGRTAWIGTVQGLSDYTGMLRVKFDGYNYGGIPEYHCRRPEELKLIEEKPKPQFKVGDRAWLQDQLVEVLEVIGDRGYRIKGDRATGCVGPNELFAEKPKTQTFHCTAKIEGTDPLPELNQALRFNTGKPESDYIFTYEGGVRAAFGKNFEFYDTFQELGELYRSAPTGNSCRVGAVLDALGNDFSDTGHSLIEHLTITNTYGSKKYAQGNYLKGANYRQYFQSLARHGEAILRGEDRDEEGNDHYGAIAFNVLMLCHCFATGIGVDDRIRAPK